MNRICYVNLLCIFLCATVVATVSVACGEDVGKPNVVLIMADDLGIDWIGCYGNDEKRTPRIDAMAESGVRFTHCYALPLCTPSRVEVMTGLYNHRNYESFASFPLGYESKTFGNLMKRAGYATCMAGKWQLGKANPSAMGFDCYLKYGVNQANQKNYYWDPTNEAIENRIYTNSDPIQTTETDYGPDIVTTFITDFIDENRDRPFFVYYPMLLCHAPYQPTPHSLDKAFQDEPHFSNEKWFGDMVQYMDTIVGRILTHLNETGLRKDTLVLFVGDNGSPYAQTSFRGKPFQGHKGCMDDAGTHVPLVASWPGTIPPGTVRGDLVDFTDFFATLADLADAEPEDATDGLSFLPQLLGTAGESRDWAFVFYTPNQRGKSNSHERNSYWARTQRWKLYHDGRLFDMELDPQEERSISPEDDTDESKAARCGLLEAFERLDVHPGLLLP